MIADAGIKATIRTRILDAWTDISPSNGRPFIRLELEGRVIAYCWRERIFGDVKQAAKHGRTVLLGIEPSQKPNRRGEPYTLVVSVA